MVRREEKKMKRRIFAVALCTVLFALCVSAHAQQPTKIPRIGLLFTATPSAAAARIEAFRQGLRELGYVDGKNIRIIVRYADGDAAKLHAIIQELITAKVDVLMGDAPALKRRHQPYLSSPQP